MKLNILILAILALVANAGTSILGMHPVYDLVSREDHTLDGNHTIKFIADCDYMGSPALITLTKTVDIATQKACLSGIVEPHSPTSPCIRLNAFQASTPFDQLSGIHLGQTLIAQKAASQQEARKAAQAKALQWQRFDKR